MTQTFDATRFGLIRVYLRALFKRCFPNHRSFAVHETGTVAFKTLKFVPFMLLSFT